MWHKPRLLVCVLRSILEWSPPHSGIWEHPKEIHGTHSPYSRGSYTAGQNPFPKGLRIERHEIEIKNHIQFSSTSKLSLSILFCLKHRLQTTAVSAACALSQTEITVPSYIQSQLLDSSNFLYVHHCVKATITRPTAELIAQCINKNTLLLAYLKKIFW